MHKVLASACVLAIAGVLAIASIGVASKSLQAQLQQNTWSNNCLERTDKHP